MNVFRMKPAHPKFDWFNNNRSRHLEYDTGETLAVVNEHGRGSWFYRNGKLALDYHNTAKENAGGQRFVVYSNPGTPDPLGRPRPRTVLATFDYAGNGIVFNHAGKIRLKYNQTEGVVLDRNLGPTSHWKWHALNDPPDWKQVVIETHLPFKDPAIKKLGEHGADPDVRRNDDKHMLAIEFDNYAKSKSKIYAKKFTPFEIRSKALKINEHFSLHIVSQSKVYLLYRDGTKNLKVNIGMALDHKEIVGTDVAEMGNVSNQMDKLPAKTNSIAELQHLVNEARALETQRTLHAKLLRLPRTASVDAMRAAASRPTRSPLLSCGCDRSMRSPLLACGCDRPDVTAAQVQLQC